MDLDDPPSLVDTSKLSLRDKPRFCIYTEDKNAKKRFTPPVMTSDIKKLQDSAVPRHTKKDIAWSVKVYIDGMYSRNEESRKVQDKDEDWGIV